MESEVSELNTNEQNESLMSSTAPNLDPSTESEATSPVPESLDHIFESISLLITAESMSVLLAELVEESLIEATTLAQLRASKTPTPTPTAVQPSLTNTHPIEDQVSPSPPPPSSIDTLISSISNGAPLPDPAENRAERLRNLARSARSKRPGRQDDTSSQASLSIVAPSEVGSETSRVPSPTSSVTSQTSTDSRSQRVADVLRKIKERKQEPPGLTPILAASAALTKPAQLPPSNSPPIASEQLSPASSTTTTAPPPPGLSTTQLKHFLHVDTKSAGGSKESSPKTESTPKVEQTPKSAMRNDPLPKPLTTPHSHRTSISTIDKKQVVQIRLESAREAFKNLCEEGNFNAATTLISELKRDGILPDLEFFTILINARCARGQVLQAQSHLQEMEKEGIKPDIHCFNAVMGAYARQSNLQTAIQIAQKVKQMKVPFNAQTYQILILGLCDRGDIEDAWSKYTEMEKLGVSPTPVTYRGLVNALCKYSAIDRALRLLPLMRARDTPLDRATYQSLCNALIDKSRSDQALQLASQSTQDNVTLDLDYFSPIITHCTARKLVTNVLECFQKMQELQISPTAELYATAIECCAQMGILTGVTSLMNDMGHEGTVPSPDILAHVAGIQAKQAKVQDSLNTISLLKQQDSKPSNSAANSLVVSLCEAKLPTEALELARDYVDFIAQDTIHSLIVSLCSSDDLSSAESFLIDVLKAHSLTPHHLPNVSSFNALISSRLARNDLPGASKLLADMELGGVQPDICTYNLVIGALTHHSKMTEAVTVFQEMQAKQISPDQETFCSLVKGFCHTGQLEEALALTKAMEPKELSPDADTLNSLARTCAMNEDVCHLTLSLDAIHGSGLPFHPETYTSSLEVLSKTAGQSSRSHAMFREMQARGLLVTFQQAEQIARALCVDGHVEKAVSFLVQCREDGLLRAEQDTLELTEYMLDQCSRKPFIKGALPLLEIAEFCDIQPSYATFMTFFTAGAAFKSDSSLLDSILRKILKMGIQPIDSFIHNAVIERCVADGNIARAQELAATMGVPPNEETYELLIDGCVKTDQGREASKLLEEMIEKGMYPEVHTWNQVIGWEAERGDPSKAADFFRMMDQKDTPPNAQTYEPILRGLCYRSGEIQKAFEMAISMMVQTKGDEATPNAVCPVIVACQEVGENGLALTLFERMLAEGLDIHPDAYTAAAIAASQTDTDRALAITNQMKSAGHLPPEHLVFSVVSSLCSKGLVASSATFVKELEKDGLQPSAKTQTELILAFSKQGNPLLAFKLLQESRKRGLVLEDQCFHAVLNAVYKKRDFYSAGPVVKDMKACGIKRSIENFVTLIAALCEERKVEESMNVLRDMAEEGLAPSSECYCALLRGMCATGHYPSAVRMMELMNKVGLEPDLDTLKIMDDSQHSPVSENESKLLNKVSEINVELEVITLASVICGACERGEVLDAVASLDRLRKEYVIDDKSKGVKVEFAALGLSARTLVSNTYEAVICALCKQKKLAIATSIIHSLREQGFAPSLPVFVEKLNAHCEDGDISGALHNIRDSEIAGNPLTPDLFESILKTCCLTRELDAAHKIMLDLKHKSLFPSNECYSLVVKSFVEGGKPQYAAEMVLQMAVERPQGPGHVPDESTIQQVCLGLLGNGSTAARALQVVEDLSKRGVPIGQQVYQSLLDGLCSSGFTSLAHNVIHKMQAQNLKVDVAQYNAILETHARTKTIDHAAPKLLREMIGAGVTPTVNTYNLVMKGLADQSNAVPKMTGVLREMRQRAVKPNVETYNNLIRGFIQRKQVSTASQYLRKMQTDKVTPSHESYDAIIQECCRTGKLDRAWKLHNEMIGKGIRPELASYNALVKGFCQQGKFEQVHHVLSSMEEADVQPDQSTFVTVITAHCKQGNIDTARSVLDAMPEFGIEPGPAAFEVLIAHDISNAATYFSEMTARGVEPSTSIFNILIENACKTLNVEEVFRLTQEMDENGIQPNETTYQLIVQCHCNRGNLEGANAALEQMTSSGFKPTLRVMNTLIAAHCTQGQIDDAVAILNSLSTHQLRPNSESFNLCIRACFSAERALLASSLVTEMRNSGAKPDVETYNALLTHHVQHGEIARAEKLLFETMRKDKIVPNAQSYAILLDALCSKGENERSTRLLSHMRRQGLGLTKPLYDSLIKGHCVKKEMLAARNVFQRMVKLGFKPDASSFLPILQMYVKDGDMRKAEAVVVDMQKTGVPLTQEIHQALIEGYCKVGDFDAASNIARETGSVDEKLSNTMLAAMAKKDPDRASTLLREMRNGGIQAAKHALDALVAARCEQGDVTTAVQLISEMEGCSPDAVTFGPLLGALCKSEKVEKALEVVGTMRSHDIPLDMGCYTPIICAYSARGRPGDLEKAMEMLSEMERAGFRPNPETWNKLVAGHVKFRNVESGTFLLAEMRRRGVAPDENCYCVLLEALFASNQVTLANSVLENMKKDGVPMRTKTYNVRIAAMCQNGQLNEALKLSLDMRKSKCAPNLATFTSLLTSVSQAGSVEQVTSLIRDMRKRGIKAPIELYEKIIVNLVAKKQLTCAWDVLRNMEQDGCAAPTLGTYNALAEGLISKGDLQEAIRVLEDMKKREIAPDDRTYGMFVKAFCQTAHVEFVDSLLADMAAQGMKPDLSVINAVLAQHCKRKDMQKAIAFLKESKAKGISPDLDTYKILMRAVCERQYQVSKRPVDWSSPSDDSGSANVGSDDVEVLLQMVEEEGLAPDREILDLIFNLYIHQGAAQKAWQLLDKMQASGLNCGVSHYHKVIIAFMEKGNIKSLTLIFETMERNGPAPTVETYNMIIEAQARYGTMAKATALLDEMKAHGLRPDQATYNVLIAAHHVQKNLTAAAKLARDMEMEGLQFDSMSAAHVLCALCAAGDIEGALSFLESSKRKGLDPDSTAYNMLLQTCCQGGHVEIAERVLAEAKMQCHQMTEASLGALAIMYCKKKLTVQASDTLRKMHKMGMEAPASAQNALLQLYCQLGHVDKVCNAVSEMQRNGIAVEHLTWSNLIEAFSKKHHFSNSDLLLSEIRAVRGLGGSISPTAPRSSEGQKVQPAIQELRVRGILSILPKSFLTGDLSLVDEETPPRTPSSRRTTSQPAGKSRGNSTGPPTTPTTARKLRAQISTLSEEKQKQKQQGAIETFLQTAKGILTEAKTPTSASSRRSSAAAASTPGGISRHTKSASPSRKRPATAANTPSSKKTPMAAPMPLFSFSGEGDNLSAPSSGGSTPSTKPIIPPLAMKLLNSTLAGPSPTLTTSTASALSTALREKLELEPQPKPQLPPLGIHAQIEQRIALSLQRSTPGFTSELLLDSLDQEPNLISPRDTDNGNTEVERTSPSGEDQSAPVFEDLSPQ